MAIININKKQFEKEIGIFDDSMQDKIAMFGTPVEKIDDGEIQLEVFPDRPDMLSYQGFKRSFLAFLGKKTGLREYKINPPEEDYIIKIEPSVKNIRPYTACAVVKGLRFDDEKIKELIEIQEKLHMTIGRKRKKVAVGIYPLEKIKLPIIFKALEPDKIRFIPLETDREMSGLEILQKHPTGREYAHLLAGKARFPIFIDANENILSMPPIINSQLTGKITDKTRDIFVECSGFDFSVLSKCLNIIVTTLSDMGGSIHQMKLQELRSMKKITPDLSSVKMELNIQNAEKLLGINLGEKQVKNLLEKMGHNYQEGKVEIPCWRVDVLHEVDLIEDIAIAYGYENFSPEIPEISTIGQEDEDEIIKRKISEILSDLAMIEVSNYHLTNKNDQFQKMGIMSKDNFVAVIDSKTDYDILRKDLSHYLIKNISENVDSEYPQRIFEIGRTFSLMKDQIIEEEHLAAAIVPGNFTEMRQILEYFFRMTDVKAELQIPESSAIPAHFIDGRVAELKVNGESVGFIGEIHPKILKSWKLKMPVAIFEINLENIFKELI